ncbi:MAG TPA: DUF4340 domain-containing protein [Chthoniobacterales bacterium]|nr:DUF4340 domain-containing protein [Chthoniobacterales bacterium]
MKKNHLLTLLIVAIVVGLAGVFLEISQSSRWNDSKAAQTIFPNLAVNDITKIEIRSTPASVTLEKKDDKWTVADRNNYPADFSKIQDLIRILWQLKAGQDIQIGPSQLSRLKVLPPGQGADSGIDIDLKGEKDNEIASLIIGKSVERTDAATGSAASGRFAYNPAVKDHVYLVSESFYGVDPVTQGAWLDKTFISPGELTEVDQAASDNNPGWKIVRKDSKADWQLEGLQSGESLEKTFAESLSSFSPTFVDVRPKTVSPDQTGLNDPFKVTIKTADAFTYNLLLGKEGPDKTRYAQFTVNADLPATRTPEPNEKPEDKKTKDEAFDKKVAGLKERLQKEKQFEKWVYLIPDYSLQQILKRRDEIISKPSPTPSPALSPTPTPAPTPVGSPSPTLAASPATSGSPEATPVSSPSPTPAASPATSGSPEATPVSSPSPTPAAAPATSGSPEASGSPAPESSPPPPATASPSPSPAVSPSASPAR